MAIAGEPELLQRTRDEIRQVLEIAEGRWAEGKIEGKIEAKRETLLRLLARAGIALTDAERARVAACTSGEVLDGWIDRVFGAKTAADVLT
jgi:hypothetical protein